MNKWENLLREYELLKSEINSKIELHNNLVVVTITAVVTILGFAIQFKKDTLLLLPFGILLPMAIRICYYRNVMAKISAYMIVFLERELPGIDWETCNAIACSEEPEREWERIKKKAASFFRNCECMILGMACAGSYIYRRLRKMGGITWENMTQIWRDPLVVGAMFCVIVLMIVTVKMNCVDKERKKWIAIWERLKEQV